MQKTKQTSKFSEISNQVWDQYTLKKADVKTLSVL